jgi:predicted kinase
MEISAKRLTSQGDRGIIDRKFTLLNQRAEIVQEGHIDLLIRLKADQEATR